MMESLACRVCLQPGLDTIDMLSAVYKAQVTFLEMFAVCTEVAMEIGENSMLCRICEQRLVAAYEFRCQAQNASLLLRRATGEQHIKQEKQDFMDDANFFDDIYSPVVEVFKQEDNFRHELKPNTGRMSVKKEHVRRKSRASGPRWFPGMLNKSHCRFCFQYMTQKLGEHEREHIRKCQMTFFSLI